MIPCTSDFKARADFFAFLIRSILAGGEMERKLAREARSKGLGDNLQLCRCTMLRL